MSKFNDQLSLLASNLSLLSADQRARIQAVLDESVPSDAMVFSQLLNAITPAIKDFDPDFTAEHFPVKNGGELEYYCGKDAAGVSPEYVLADLARRGRRAGTAVELLRYWHEHPGHRKHLIVALGQIWDEKVLILGDFNFGNLRVVLHEFKRSLDAENCRFLSFPL